MKRTNRSEALELSRVRSEGFVFQVEILRRLLDLPGTRAIEVPIVFRERVLGRSKLTRRIVLEAVGEVAALVLRERVGPRRVYPPLERGGSTPPRVTVVVPTAPGDGPPKAVEGLRTLSHPVEKLEVVIARGRSPSRQRNLAAGATRGEFLLFLDDDSVPERDLLALYLQSFRRDPTLGAVGGPAESSPGSAFQDLAALVLGEPWVTGKTASRYRARGETRLSDERELILCNLCVRREAFEEVGGFNESFYPNEENEFLERLRRGGWRLLYRPDAIARRAQRETPRALLEAVHRYGRGRALQIRALPSRSSAGRLVAGTLSLLGAAAFLAGVLSGVGLFFLPVALYGAYLALLTLNLSLRAGPRRGLSASVLAALLHGTYALGLLGGLLSPGRPRAASPIELERIDVKGVSQEEAKR